jgi:hypothetical protein
LAEPCADSVTVNAALGEEGAEFAGKFRYDFCARNRQKFSGKLLQIPF